jgi:CRP-like cAMP-binding protein
MMSKQQINQLFVALGNESSWFPPEGLEQLAEMAFVQRVKSRTTLTGEWLYLLLTGAVKLTCRVKTTRKRMLIMVYGAGDIFGPLFKAFPGVPNTDLETMTDCVIAKAPPSMLVDLVAGMSASTVTRLMENLLRGRWKLMLQSAGLLGERVPGRIADVLVDLGSRFGIEDTRGTILNLHITHGDLAGMVGCSRELATKVLIDFQRRGLITRDGRRLIIHPAKLEKLGLLSTIKQRSRATDQKGIGLKAPTPKGEEQLPRHLTTARAASKAVEIVTNVSGALSRGTQS